MIPHSALNWAVNGVLGAICHSVYSTGLFHSFTCLSCTAASVWLIFHTEGTCTVEMIMVSGLQITERASLIYSVKYIPQQFNTYTFYTLKNQTTRYSQPAAECLMCNKYG